MNIPCWNQIVDGAEYPIVIPHGGTEAADRWAEALTYAQYLGRDWVVRRGWVVGAEPGLGYLVPEMDTIDPPEWVKQ